MPQSLFDRVFSRTNTHLLTYILDSIRGVYSMIHTFQGKHRWSRSLRKFPRYNASH
jgi:hypothetical protein